MAFVSRFVSRALKSRAKRVPDSPGGKNLPVTESFGVQLVPRNLLIMRENLNPAEACPKITMQPIAGMLRTRGLTESTKTYLGRTKFQTGSTVRLKFGDRRFRDGHSFLGWIAPWSRRW
jgi:hypothetical protein